MADLRVFISETTQELAQLLGDYLKKIRAHHSPDDIHEARIASRRLRASLEFAEHLGASTKPLSRRLKKINKPLSLLRTQDSLLSLLSELNLPDTQEAQKFLARQIKKKRRRSTPKALVCLKKRRLKGIPKLTKRLLGSLHRTPDNLSEAKPLITGSVLRGRLQALLEHISSLSPDPSTPALHRARILMKRLRYSWELASRILGVKAEAQLERFQEAQKLGGDFHDLAQLYEEAALLQRDKPTQEGVDLLLKQLSALTSEARGRFLAVVKATQPAELEAELGALLDLKKPPV